MDALDPVQHPHCIGGAERCFDPAAHGNVCTAVVFRVVWMDPAAFGVYRGSTSSRPDLAEDVCRFPTIRKLVLRNEVEVARLNGEMPSVESLVLESMPVARRAADEEDRRVCRQVAAHLLILSHGVGRIAG